MKMERYLELKAKGKIKVEKIGNKPMVIISNWEKETGDREDDSVLPIDTTSLENQLLDTQNLLDGLTAFLADVEIEKNK